jgi:hypothetical protein
MKGKMKEFADASMGRIASLENRLSGVLRPVQPRKEFVHGVAQRIQAGPQTALVDRIADWHLLAMVLAGLVSLAVFLAVVGRTLLSLLGKKHTG